MIHSQTQQTATGNAHSLPGLRFDRFQLTTLLSKELQGFLGVLVMAFFSLFVLITTLQSLVIIVSGGRVDICDRFWEPAFAVGIALLLYTFHVWRTDHIHFRNRLATQWIVWVMLSLGLCVCGFCSVKFFFVITGLYAGLVFLGFVVCKRWVPIRVDNGRDMFGFRSNEELARLAKAGEVYPLEVKREQRQRILTMATCTLVIFPVLFVVGTVAVAKLGERLAISALEIRYQGKMAPVFTFTTIDDESWALADRRGKVVVLDDWRSRETNCREQVSLWKKLAENYAKRDDLVIATVSAENKESAHRWRKKYDATWQVLVSPYAVSIFRPVVVAGKQPVSIIDRKGFVTLITTDLEQVEQEIERLMAL